MLLALLIIAGAIALAVLCMLVAMADGIQSPRSWDEEPHRIADVTPRPRPDPSERTLTILTWNIAWAYGWGSEGQGKRKSKLHFEDGLVRMGEIIASLDPDVAVLQEVDFESTRSHRIEQTEAIARASSMPHYAEALSWRARWVPYPYGLGDHFGRMRSGGAILSRTPIGSHRVELHPKPGANPIWYNLFYLFRYLERAEIEIGDRTIQIFNTHLEAFDEANRIEQAARTKTAIEARITPLTILAGDFNTVPPESTRKRDYPDEDTVKTEHERDRTLEILRSIDGLSDVLPDARFLADESAFFTFPAHAANRKLDYIFVGRAFEVIEARVVKEAGAVSDHLPLVAKVRLR